MINRDFKGVWIPKDIWLSKDLTMLEKVMLVEISSLDNEEHCTAGNKYFAEFCNCSESAVSKAINKLQELGFIKIESFDGRHRKVSLVKFTKQPSKIYEAASENLLTNNINTNISNNTNNTKTFLSKDKNVKKDEDFIGSVKLLKQEKDNDRIEQFLDYYKSLNLPSIKKISDKRRKAILNILNGFDGSEIKQVLDNYSNSDFLLGKSTDFKANIDWILKEDNFIKILEGKYNNRVSKKNTFNDNAISESYTQKELEELDKIDKEREARGLQTRF